MHNSKRIRRMIIAIALIIVILLGLDYLLYPCTFMRNDIHTVTTQKHQDIFMGTSHGKMNIDPKTISSVTGRTGHNLCVGGEYGIDAYYLAKLLLEKQKPERIIYEVDPGHFAIQMRTILQLLDNHTSCFTCSNYQGMINMSFRFSQSAFQHPENSIGESGKYCRTKQ